MVNAHTQLYIILLATEQPQSKVGVVYLQQVLNNMSLFPVGAIDRRASQSVFAVLPIKQPKIKYSYINHLLLGCERGDS